MNPPGGQRKGKRIRLGALQTAPDGRVRTGWACCPPPHLRAQKLIPVPDSWIPGIRVPCYPHEPRNQV
eukprot:748145-Heterocapsa_arctica.AAC.1